MIGLTVKNIIIKKQLKIFFKVPGVLFCTINNIMRTVSMQIGWFTDLPLRMITPGYIRKSQNASE